MSASSPPRPPSRLRRLGTDEYVSPALNELQRRAVRSVVERGPSDAGRTNLSLGDYWSSRLGTAAGLRAINEQFGASFYQVPVEAMFDQRAADEAFRGSDVVV